jgi:6-phosphogluconate dehydrogenase
MASDDVQSFAIVGLGNIGGNLARQALDKGFRVVGYTLGGPSGDLVPSGLVPVDGLNGLRTELAGPRRIFLYVPAGPAVDAVLADLATVVEAGDVVVDGGNSYWGDSIRRHRRLAARGVHFVDLGTSGGIPGARHGACMMAGGEAAAVALIEPIVRRLTVEGGFVHAGPAGAGHFTKLVHNGIEFGMLQAIAEGIDLLEGHRDELPVADVLRCWRHGSVIRSWLIDLIEEGYREKGGLGAIPPVVEDTGEVNWLVDDALHMEIPTPVIAQSVIALLASRDDRRRWARAIAVMRHGFGGHPFGRDERFAAARRTSRIGGFPAADE